MKGWRVWTGKMEKGCEEEGGWEVLSMNSRSVDQQL